VSQAEDFPHCFKPVLPGTSSLEEICLHIYLTNYNSPDSPESHGAMKVVTASALDGGMTDWAALFCRKDYIKKVQDSCKT